MINDTKNRKEESGRRKHKTEKKNAAKKSCNKNIKGRRSEREGEGSREREQRMQETKEEGLKDITQKIVTGITVRGKEISNTLRMTNDHKK